MDLEEIKEMVHDVEETRVAAPEVNETGAVDFSEQREMTRRPGMPQFTRQSVSEESESSDDDQFGCQTDGTSKRHRRKQQQESNSSSSSNKIR